jgi:thiosulfate/3-mercaptopyruvate sulfurtransferase
MPGSFVAAEPLPGFATVDADLLGKELQRGACALDARAPDRYAGQNEPIDPVAGHIPGARNLPYGSLLQADGTLLPTALLREKIQAALDGTLPANALLYCGSGVTACALHLAFTTANLAGAKGPRVYPGIWIEWCRQPERPVATGPTP